DKRVLTRNRPGPHFLRRKATARFVCANSPATAIDLHRSAPKAVRGCASFRCLLPDENRRPQENATQVVLPAFCPQLFCRRQKLRKQLRSQRPSLRMPSGLLKEKRRNHEQGVESPHTDVSRL